MRKQSEGLIINVSSGRGRFSAPFTVVYNASKFALEGLSEGLHYEVRPLGVDVAIVQPGAHSNMVKVIETAIGPDPLSYHIFTFQMLLKVYHSLCS
jgi:short-subunit dehydrogenase